MYKTIFPPRNLEPFDFGSDLIVSGWRGVTSLSNPVSVEDGADALFDSVRHRDNIIKV